MSQRSNRSTRASPSRSRSRRADGSPPERWRREEPVLLDAASRKARAGGGGGSGGGGRRSGGDAGNTYFTIEVQRGSDGDGGEDDSKGKGRRKDGDGAGQLPDPARTPDCFMLPSPRSRTSWREGVAGDKAFWPPQTNSPRPWTRPVVMPLQWSHYPMPPCCPVYTYPYQFPGRPMIRVAPLVTQLPPRPMPAFCSGFGTGPWRAAFTTADQSYQPFPPCQPPLYQPGSPETLVSGVRDTCSVTPCPSDMSSTVGAQRSIDSPSPFRQSCPAGLPCSKTTPRHTDPPNTANVLGPRISSCSPSTGATALPAELSGRCDESSCDYAGCSSGSSLLIRTLCSPGIPEPAGSAYLTVPWCPSSIAGPNNTSGTPSPAGPTCPANPPCPAMPPRSPTSTTYPLDPVYQQRNAGPAHPTSTAGPSCPTEPPSNAGPPYPMSIGGPPSLAFSPCKSEPRRSVNSSCNTRPTSTTDLLCLSVRPCSAEPPHPTGTTDPPRHPTSPACTDVDSCDDETLEALVKRMMRAARELPEELCREEKASLMKRVHSLRELRARRISSHAVRAHKSRSKVTICEHAQPSSVGIFLGTPEISEQMTLSADTSSAKPHHVVPSSAAEIDSNKQQTTCDSCECAGRSSATVQLVARTGTSETIRSSISAESSLGGDCAESSSVVVSAVPTQRLATIPELNEVCSSGDTKLDSDGESSATFNVVSPRLPPTDPVSNSLQEACTLMNVLLDTVATTTPEALHSRLSANVPGWNSLQESCAIIKKILENISSVESDDVTSGTSSTAPESNAQQDSSALLRNILKKAITVELNALPSYHLSSLTGLSALRCSCTILSGILERITSHAGGSSTEISSSLPHSSAVLKETISNSAVAPEAFSSPCPTESSLTVSQSQFESTINIATCPTDLSLKFGSSPPEDPVSASDLSVPEPGRSPNSSLTQSESLCLSKQPRPDCAKICTMLKPEPARTCVVPSLHPDPSSTDSRSNYLQLSCSKYLMGDTLGNLSTSQDEIHQQCGSPDSANGPTTTADCTGIQTGVSTACQTESSKCGSHRKHHLSISCNPTGTETWKSNNRKGCGMVDTAEASTMTATEDRKTGQVYRYPISTLHRPYKMNSSTVTVKSTSTLTDKIPSRIPRAISMKRSSHDAASNAQNTEPGKNESNKCNPYLNATFSSISTSSKKLSSISASPNVSVNASTSSQCHYCSYDVGVSTDNSGHSSAMCAGHSPHAVCSACGVAANSSWLRAPISGTANMPMLCMSMPIPMPIPVPVPLPCPCNRYGCHLNRPENSRSNSNATASITPASSSMLLDSEEFTQKSPLASSVGSQSTQLTFTSIPKHKPMTQTRNNENNSSPQLLSPIQSDSNYNEAAQCSQRFLEKSNISVDKNNSDRQSRLEKCQNTGAEGNLGELNQMNGNMDVAGNVSQQNRKLKEANNIYSVVPDCCHQEETDDTEKLRNHEDDKSETCENREKKSQIHNTLIAEAGKPPAVKGKSSKHILHKMLYRRVNANVPDTNEDEDDDDGVEKSNTSLRCAVKQREQSTVRGTAQPLLIFLPRMADISEMKGASGECQMQSSSLDTELEKYDRDEEINESMTNASTHSASGLVTKNMKKDESRQEAISCLMNSGNIKKEEHKSPHTGRDAHLLRVSSKSIRTNSSLSDPEFVSQTTNETEMTSTIVSRSAHKERLTPTPTLTQSKERAHVSSSELATAPGCSAQTPHELVTPRTSSKLSHAATREPRVWSRLMRTGRDALTRAILEHRTHQETTEESVERTETQLFADDCDQVEQQTLCQRGANPSGGPVRALYRPPLLRTCPAEDLTGDSSPRGRAMLKRKLQMLSSTCTPLLTERAYSPSGHAIPPVARSSVQLEIAALHLARAAQMGDQRSGPSVLRKAQQMYRQQTRVVERAEAHQSVSQPRCAVQQPLKRDLESREQKKSLQGQNRPTNIPGSQAIGSLPDLREKQSRSGKFSPSREHSNEVCRNRDYRRTSIQQQRTTKPDLDPRARPRQSQTASRSPAADSPQRHHGASEIAASARVAAHGASSRREGAYQESPSRPHVHSPHGGPSQGAPPRQQSPSPVPHPTPPPKAPSPGPPLPSPETPQPTATPSDLTMCPASLPLSPSVSHWPTPSSSLVSTPTPSSTTLPASSISNSDNGTNISDVSRAAKNDTAYKTLMDLANNGQDNRTLFITGVCMRMLSHGHKEDDCSSPWVKTSQKDCEAGAEEEEKTEKDGERQPKNGKRGGAIGGHDTSDATFTAGSSASALGPEHASPARGSRSPLLESAAGDACAADVGGDVPSPPFTSGARDSSDGRPGEAPAFAWYADPRAPTTDESPAAVAVRRKRYSADDLCVRVRVRQGVEEAGRASRALVPPAASRVRRARTLPRSRSMLRALQTVVKEAASA